MKFAQNGVGVFAGMGNKVEIYSNKSIHLISLNSLVLRCSIVYLPGHQAIMIMINSIIDSTDYQEPPCTFDVLITNSILVKLQN